MTSDRYRNLLAVERRQSVDGAWHDVKLPFACDVCHTNDACYGLNGRLYCTACWQQR